MLPGSEGMNLKPLCRTLDSRYYVVWNILDHQSRDNSLDALLAGKTAGSVSMEFERTCYVTQLVWEKR